MLVLWNAAKLAGTLLGLRFPGIEETASLLEVSSRPHLMLLCFILVLVQLASILFSEFTLILIWITYDCKWIEVLIFLLRMGKVDEGVVC